jgi:hypothetical protein
MSSMAGDGASAALYPGVASWMFNSRGNLADVMDAMPPDHHTEAAHFNSVSMLDSYGNHLASARHGVPQI